VKAVWEEEVELQGIGFVKQEVLSRQWKEGVLDEQSGETEEEEVIVEGIVESEVEVDEEIEGVDSRDTVKHTERIDQ